MVSHAWEHIDYYDNTAILNAYYAEVEALVRRQTGATRAIALDHNLPTPPHISPYLPISRLEESAQLLDVALDRRVCDLEPARLQRGSRGSG